MQETHDFHAAEFSSNDFAVVDNLWDRIFLIDDEIKINIENVFSRADALLISKRLSTFLSNLKYGFF